MITPAVLERDAVIVTCAISAGIHGALVPGHLAEGRGAGPGFLGATVVLAALAASVTPPRGRRLERRHSALR